MMGREKYIEVKKQPPHNLSNMVEVVLCMATNGTVLPVFADDLTADASIRIHSEE